MVAAASLLGARFLAAARAAGAAVGEEAALAVRFVAAFLAPSVGGRVALPTPPPVLAPPPTGVA